MNEDSENLPLPMANVNVKEMLTSLNKPNKLEKDRLAAYSFLASSLEPQKDTAKIIQQYSPQLFKYLSRDLLSQEHGIVTVVTKIILHCVKDKQFLERVTKHEAEALLLAVLKVGKEKQSEDVTKQLLCILAQQKLPSGIVISHVTAILDTLGFIYTEGNGKALYGADVLEVLYSLCESTTPVFKDHAHRWCRMVFPCLGHPVASVRTKSFELLRNNKSSLCGNLELGKIILKTVDNDLGKALLLLVAKSPQYVMDVWCLVLDIAGKAIHKGSTINVMLEIIESGFKGSQESRIFSFRAWRSLIDNFALEQDVISDAKRMRLVMMVLKTNNAKIEAVAVEKLQTWWHFARKIGTKLPSVLDQIVFPLLQFCVGSGNQPSQTACPSPNFALKISSPCASKALANIQSRMGSQQLPSFPLLQKIGFEVIGQLVSKPSETSKVQGIKWTIDPLPNEVFASSVIFVKHAPSVMSFLEKLLKTVGSQDRESLIVHIWTSLSSHLKAALEKGGKAECRDVFGAFLSLFHSLVRDDCLQSQIIVTMFQSTSNFPNKVLSSSLYNTGAGTAVKGCPALLLCEILFMPAFLNVSNEEDTYLSLFSGIVSAGASNQQGALSFIQAVADILDSASANIVSGNILYRLWNILAHSLLDFVIATNEVNQGDALEYNFGCLYAVLLFPVQHQLASKVSQGVCKAMLRTWKELYHSFARLSALVTNAEANTCLEEISSKVIKMWRSEFKDAANLEYLALICMKMLDCVDFSAVSASRKQSSFTLSPSKWTKRRQRPLANLHSFVQLLEKMQTESNTLLDLLGDKAFSQKQVGSPSCLLSYTNTVIEVYTHLFTHIPATVVSHILAVLTSPIARLYYSKAHGTGSVKIFVPSVMTKLEKLWFEICNCVTGRFSDQYDSYFLAIISPLLEVTFPHFRRAIKSQTLTFWSTTFSKSVGLTYPDNLKPVLSAIKEKTAIVLPGWITIDDNVIAETPFTEVSQSQGESQVPVPVLPGFPSPKRLQKGSFLHKDLSPARKSPAASKVSPAKVISPKDAKALFSSCRNISMDLNMMSDKDFVVISSPTKRRRVLTEHQKEVLKEKRVIPAMYNNLDASQDTSLMAHLNAESQQESMSCADVIVINDSQATQGKEKVISNDSQKGFGSRESSNCSSGFTVPKQLKVPVRRRSSRIQEMSDDDSQASKSHGAPAKKTTFKESEKIQEEDGLNEQQLASNNEGQNNNLEKDREDNLVLSSLGTSMEIPSETPQSTDSSSSTSDKSDLSAFGMFRTKKPSSNILQLDTGSKASTPDPKPRRVSLRKIQSHEGESSLDAPTALKVTEPEMNKGKSPRRVPLQRIHDQKSSCQNAEPEAPSTSFVVLSQEEKSRQESESVVESKKTRCSLDKWLAKSNPPKTTRRVSPRKKRKFSEVEEEEEKSPIIPITLVEDTQSPGKMGKPHSESASIAETPVKSDDSPSPAIRSVRKLFVDDEPGAPSTSNSVVCDTPKTHVVKLNSSAKSIDSSDEVPQAELNKDVVDNDEMEVLSQGFDTAEEESQAVAVDALLQEKDTLNSGSKADDPNVQDMPQSEILFANSEGTVDSMLMTMHMPTLASQPKDFGFTGCKPDSSSSSRTSSSVESDPKDKTLSGTESEFDPSQATLREECNKTTSVRKKTVVRETLASTRTRRSVVRREDSTSAKGSSKSEDIVAEENVEQGSSKSEGLLTEGSVLCDMDKMEVEVEEIALQGEKAEEKETSQKPISNEDVSKSKEELSHSSLEVGEITPVIKSTSENPSTQRCSTTKKKRLMAKQLAEQRQMGTELTDAPHVEQAQAVKSDTLKRKSTKKSDGRLLSSTRRRISPVASPPGLRSKHMLRIRTKAVKRLSQSPPTKRRRFEIRDANNDVTEDSSADDNQTLSSLVKQAKSQPQPDCGKETKEKKKVSEDDSSEDDQSLSSLAKQAKSLPPVCGKETVETIKILKVVAHKIEVAEKLVDDESEDDQPLASLVSVNAEGNRAESIDLILKESDNQDSLPKEQPEACEVITVESSQDDMMEVEPAQSGCEDDDGVQVTEENKSIIEDKDSVSDEMPSTEEEIPPGQVAPQMDIEGSDQSSGSDEVFENAKSNASTDACVTEIFDKEMEVEVTSDEKLEAAVQLEAGKEKPEECNEEKQRESSENGDATACNVSDEKKCDVGDDVTVETKEDSQDEQKQASEFVLSNWSPSKSPSCSILRKLSTPSSSDRGSRKVSFAEPVVSGESPVREKYHSESLPTSPLICHSYNIALTRPGSPGIKPNRGSSYRRRLETSMKKQVHNNLRQRCSGSPSQSPSSQNTYKATQESQLDSINPIFPDLVNCKTSLDCILPQLTSSLWYRGLCQLMKGRNLHTIGDLSALTEVQVNQMPIRCPKVDTVRDALTNYQNQHGGGSSTPKSQCKSIFGNTTPSLDVSDNTYVSQGSGTPRSNGATLSQAVTPSSIADEGIKILPSAEHELSQLSPIKDPNVNTTTSAIPQMGSTSYNSATSSSSSSSSVLPSSSTSAEVLQSGSSAYEYSTSSKKSTNIVNVLSSIADSDSVADLKGLSMSQLFEVHQKLNSLFGVVVEEMKERSVQS